MLAFLYAPPLTTGDCGDDHHNGVCEPQFGWTGDYSVPEAGQCYILDDWNFLDDDAPDDCFDGAVVLNAEAGTDSNGEADNMHTSFGIGVGGYTSKDGDTGRGAQNVADFFSMVSRCFLPLATKKNCTSMESIAACICQG